VADVPDNAQDTGLSGRVAIVTGAATGLGRSEAIGLARAGAQVIVNDVAAALESSDVVEEVSRYTTAVPVSGDVSMRSTADALMAAAEAQGGLDIVVNNAGIARDRMLFNVNDEEWDEVIAVCLRGHFLMTRNAAAYWRSRAKESGGQIYGRLINTSSESALLGPPGQPNYSAAKAGIVALTLSAARALNRYGVCANAICPRARTPMTAGVYGDEPELGAGDVDPLSPDHVAMFVRYLASPASATVTGQVFVVAGRMILLLAAPSVATSIVARGPAWNLPELNLALRDCFAARDPELNYAAFEVNKMNPP
jgi:NAD(P)-dependent dehydrogenase (short-subunit alcohol dehydrogenase family)